VQPNRRFGASSRRRLGIAVIRTLAIMSHYGDGEADAVGGNSSWCSVSDLLMGDAGNPDRLGSTVTPAQAGVQRDALNLDSGFRRNDTVAIQGFDVPLFEVFPASSFCVFAISSSFARHSAAFSA
jgi:hypothetical protein